MIERYENTACADLDVVQLAGDLPHRRPEDQAVDLPRPVLADIKDAARKALFSVEPAGMHINAYTLIRQGETESFGSFLDRLTQAVEKQCQDEQARPYIVQNLASVNANDECRKIILTLPDQPPAVMQMLTACSRFTVPQHLANLQVNALGKTLEDNLTQRMDKIEKLLEKQEKTLENSVSTTQLDSDKRPCCFACGRPGHFKKDCHVRTLLPNQLSICP